MLLFLTTTPARGQCSTLTFFRLPLFLLILAAGSLYVQPATAAEDWQVDFSGMFRPRFNNLHNQFRPGLAGDDQALNLLTLLQVQADHGNWTLLGELQDSRNYLNDEDSALLTIDINTLEPLQAYVQYRFDDVADGSLAIKAGRHTMDLGGRRLVARQRYRNTLTNFNGINGRWRHAAGHDLTLFWVLPVLIQPADRTALLDNDIELDDEDADLQFWGAFYRTPPLWHDIQVELYLFGLHERDDPAERQTPDRELLTPGLRFIRSPATGAWDIDLEAIWQRGTRRATRGASDTRTLDVAARFAHASAGYTFATAWQPRLSAEYDFASGEGHPADAGWDRFDTLFAPRRAEFNPTGIYGPLGRENIRSFGARLTLAPSARTDAFLSFRRNDLDAATDAFARTGVRDPAGRSGTDGGDQWEFRVRHWLVPERVRWETGGAWFDLGTFMKTAPNANRAGDPLFFYTDLTISF